MKTLKNQVVLTRSNAVEQARGWVATKMGFFDIFFATETCGARAGRLYLIYIFLLALDYHKKLWCFN